MPRTIKTEQSGATQATIFVTKNINKNEKHA